MRLSVGSIVRPVKRNKIGQFAAKASAIKNKVLVGVVMFLMLVVASSMNWGTTIEVQNVITEAPQKESMAQVMQRIADCESGNGKHGSAHQFNADGSLVTNTNSNGTVDVGRYQINLSAQHLKEMAKMGLNPLTEEGNEAYAKYLYETRGTSDWSSSQRCWQ